MSYRNDHDAALSRVDALEAELETLRVADPYGADGYASAPQLWREYDRALSARDAILRELAPRL